MRGIAHGRVLTRLFMFVTLLGCFLVAFGPTEAKADPECVDRGAYVLFARGSGEKFDGSRAQSFRHHIMRSLADAGISSKWAELGNVDGSVKPSEGRGPNDPAHEYPAVPVNDWNAVKLLNPWYYSGSVTTGKNELVAHLNDRYSGNGPKGTGACANETLVLGGYSQGADVVGWALRSSELSQAAKDHIGYAALYGDPKFDPGTLNDRLYATNFQSNWRWVRGDDAGYRYRGVFGVRNSGILGAREPYVPDEFKGRFGSWCADHDGICSGIFPRGTDVHGAKYQDYWIQKSAAEIVYVAKQKRDYLIAGNNSTMVNDYVNTMPLMALPGYYAEDMTPVAPPPPPLITQVTRTYGPDGSRQVYAATKSAVTEGWWIPGGEGVHSSEMIHIAQDNIVSFDKVNLPDGKQALFTAVPDGIWETDWDSQHSPKSAKIITGLSGVRQVIADNRWEPKGYTHRLYILAADGPHEYWWRDGGEHGDSLLDAITGPVTMTKSTAPDGADELYVATPTWVYELKWGAGHAFTHRPVINVTQGDIRSLGKGANLDGGELLYTGTSTTAWQSYWEGDSKPDTGTIATGQAHAIQIEKTVTDGTHQLYLATGDHVQEYWWGTNDSGGGELIRISQNNITSFDKETDGADQQLYTGAGDQVWETWWRAGTSPKSKVLYKVAR